MATCPDNNNDDREDNLSAADEESRLEESLEECLEPRPPMQQEFLPQEGSESPKDVQKKLMRKVNLMSSNGNSTACQEDKPTPKHTMDTSNTTGNKFLSNLFKRYIYVHVYTPIPLTPHLYL